MGPAWVEEAVVLKKLFGRQDREPGQVVLYTQPT
jgi:hypothetical protein